MNVQDQDSERMIRVRLARLIEELVEEIGIKAAHRDFCDLAQSIWNFRSGQDEKLDLDMIRERRR